MYNHIALSPQDYQSYFTANKYQVEDFQSGGRYVEIDLFSKLTTREYLEEFVRADFDLLKIILEISDDGLKYKNTLSHNFQNLVANLQPQGISEDDLLIKTNLILLRKRL